MKYHPNQLATGHHQHDSGGREETIFTALRVLYEVIAHVLGHSAMYWYRATQAMGRASIVGSTVQDSEAIPPHLVADEKHSWWWGERIYMTVIAAAGCFLGVSVAETADAVALKAMGFPRCLSPALYSDQLRMRY